MALFGVAPDVMKPSRPDPQYPGGQYRDGPLYRAGLFSWRVFMPLAIGAMPLAYVGGSIRLPDTIYRQVVGVFLLFVAYRMLVPQKRRESREPAPKIAFPIAIAVTARSGLARWSDRHRRRSHPRTDSDTDGPSRHRQMGGVSAAFILVNSLAGIAGCLSYTAQIPSEIAWWALAAVAGGLIGSEVGVKHLGEIALRRLLALVLVITGVKLIAK